MPVQAAAIYYELGQVQQAQGRLEAALGTCREALEVAAAIHPALPPAGAAHVRMADVLRERNQLDAATDHATRGIELCRQLDYAWPLAAGPATLAWIQHAQGDQDGARQTIAEAEAEQVLPDPRLVERLTQRRHRRHGWRWPRDGPPTPPAGPGTAGWKAAMRSATRGSASISSWPGCWSPNRAPIGRWRCWSACMRRPRASNAPAA